MAKSSIELRISAIAQMLSEGKRRGEIVQICTKKYKTIDSTIDKYIRQAKLMLQHGPLAAKIEAKQDAAIAASEISKVKSYIQKREILAEIMDTKQATTQMLAVVIQEDGSKKYRPVKAFTKDLTLERIKAIEADNRMTGDNAPEKQSVEGKFVIVGMQVL